MVAGVATRRHYTEEKVQTLNDQMARLKIHLKNTAAKYALPFATRRLDGLMNIYFSEELPVVNQLRTDQRRSGLFHLACQNNGIMIAPLIVMNTSTVMGEGELCEVMERFDDAMRDVADAA